MRKPIFIASWKMYLDFRQSLELAKKIKRNLNHPPYSSLIRKGDIEAIICPSFVSLEKIGEIFKGTGLRLGAQDVFWVNQGAFTGEISPKDLKALGCRYAIIGHSERRIYLRETDEMINLKLKAALAESLIPILCVGETAKEKNAGRGKLIIEKQIKEALKEIRIEGKSRVIIAYEPIWAIGGGRSATPEDAESIAEFIRKILAKLYSAKKAKDNFSVLYGGSVNSSSAKFFISQKNIDGVLAGGASTKAEEFVRIIRNIGG